MARCCFLHVTVAQLLLIPGHALHEWNLQGQIGVGPLVSNQERRVDVINQSLTGFRVPPSN